MIDLNTLKTLLHYDPITGNFTHLTGRNKGKVAGAAHGKNGKYWFIRKADKRYFVKVKDYAHILAYFYMTGFWPLNEIDHKDGNGRNNAWNNLREVTHQQNLCNRGKNRNNTSGFKGVYRHSSCDRWFVDIVKDYQHHYFGTFEDYNEACKVASAMRKQLHGQFATD